jgi:tetratricopeptide (TPR) repeat protein
MKPKHLVISVIITSLLHLGFSSITTANTNDDEQTIYEQTQKLIDSYPSNPDALLTAEKLLQQLLTSNPQSTSAYIGLGRLAYKKGYINFDNYESASLKQAHGYFSKALAINPALFDAYYYGTYPYLFEKNYVKAKEMALTAQRINPDAAQIDLLFAEIAKQEENYQEVEHYAQHILPRTSDKKLLKDAHSLLASVYKFQQRYDLAEKSYSSIIELDPTSPWSHINYSKFLIDLGRYDDAINYGKKALAIMDFGMGHHILANAYYQKGAELLWQKRQPDKAEEYFVLAINHNPEDANAYYGLGLSHYHIGHSSKNISELEKAEQALMKAIDLNSELKQAQGALDQLHLLLRAVK